MTTRCVCCANLGVLPHLPGIPEAVHGNVVKEMCVPCVDAAFLGGGSHPHPLSVEAYQ